jgi:hypothetical protein
MAGPASASNAAKTVSLTSKKQGTPQWRALSACSRNQLRSVIVSVIVIVIAMLP